MTKEHYVGNINKKVCAFKIIACKTPLKILTQ